MDSQDPIRDFFTFLLGAVLLSMGAFLFFNQIMVSSEPMGLGLRFGQGIGRSWWGGYGSGFGGGGWGAGFGIPQGLGDSFGLVLFPWLSGSACSSRCAISAGAGFWCSPQ